MHLQLYDQNLFGIYKLFHSNVYLYRNDHITLFLWDMNDPHIQLASKNLNQYHIKTN